MGSALTRERYPGPPAEQPHPGSKRCLWVTARREFSTPSARRTSPVVDRSSDSVRTQLLVRWRCGLKTRLTPPGDSGYTRTPVKTREEAIHGPIRAKGTGGEAPQSAHGLPTRPLLATSFCPPSDSVSIADLGARAAASFNSFYPKSASPRSAESSQDHRSADARCLHAEFFR